MDDADVVRMMHRLAVRGEYRDYFYSRPDPDDPPRPEPLPDGSPDAAAIARWLRVRKRPTRFVRDTPAYREARDLDLLEPLPSLRPASPEAIADEETQLRVRLPDLLRRLYLEVGNGGFGPGNGIAGVRGGEPISREALVDCTDPQIPDPTRPADVRPGLLYIFDWGCAIGTMMDCRTPEGWIWHWDPNGPPGTALRPTHMTLGDWLVAWADHGFGPNPGDVKSNHLG